MRANINPTIPCLLLVLGACGSMPFRPPAPAAAGSGSVTPSVSPAASAEEGTLYARDGSVVAAGTQSSRAGTESPRAGTEPKREIGDREGSRVYLLELYQKSMDDKNALGLEVESLRAALEEQRRIDAAAVIEQERLVNELAKATQERDALRAQAFELASRITSAQIARLEAEKALLELRIESQRSADDAPGGRTSPPAGKTQKRTGGTKP